MFPMIQLFSTQLFYFETLSQTGSKRKEDLETEGESSEIMVLVVAGGLKLILGDTRDRYAAWADFGLLKLL